MSKNKKEQKPSERELATQAIAKMYREEFGVTPIIVSANLPKMQPGYAAVTQEHIQIFKYDKIANGIVSISTHNLSDYVSVIVDRYAVKAVFEFKGDNSTFTFVPVGQGKEIERLIRANTNIEIHKSERKWYQKILGFRSGKAWKMVVACFIYFMIFGTIFNLITGKGKEESKKQTTQTAATEVKNEVQKPEKQAEPKPVEEKKPATLEEKIKDVVKDKMGKKSLVNLEINDNAGTEQEGDKVVLLTLDGKDRITTNMTKSGMWLDTKDILEKLVQEKEISEITFFYQFNLVDQYGNEKKENVMKIKFDRNTIDKINFKNFNHKNTPNIATDYWSHPALDKK
ncbi:hypothetical protein [Bacillus wiedmannii]|uniref:hypothetical protein n=1 Tax=Bacillus wiedmannii TaxID=1890302 RepID=UPI001F09ACBA|nr:hypothetical protein [Bacillus wiedmannii]MCX3317567.1 hypothetical protein [Bacillus wiedmannii]